MPTTKKLTVAHGTKKGWGNGWYVRLKGEPRIFVTYKLLCSCTWAEVFGNRSPCRHVRAVREHKKTSA